MKKFLAIAALSLVSSSAFAAVKSMTVYGATPAAVQQKVAAAMSTIAAGGIPMQLAGNKACTESERNEFPKSIINPIVRVVRSVTYNDNTFVVAADGSLQPTFSATLKVYCGHKLLNK